MLLVILLRVIFLNMNSKRGRTILLLSCLCEGILYNVLFVGNFAANVHTLALADCFSLGSKVILLSLRIALPYPSRSLS